MYFASRQGTDDRRTNPREKFRTPFSGYTPKYIRFFFLFFFLSQTVAFISFVSFYVHAFSLYHHKSYKYFRSSVVDVFRAPQWPISSDLVRKIYFRLTPVTHCGGWGGGVGLEKAIAPIGVSFFFYVTRVLLTNDNVKLLNFFDVQTRAFSFDRLLYLLRLSRGLSVKPRSVIFV